MITISKKPVFEKPEKKYRVIEVAKALGLSEGQVMGYFSNRGISAKNGLTLEQIETVAFATTRGSGVRWEDVKDIRERLSNERGVEITKDPEDF